MTQLHQPVQPIGHAVPQAYARPHGGTGGFDLHMALHMATPGGLPGGMPNGMSGGAPGGASAGKPATYASLLALQEARGSTPARGAWAGAQRATAATGADAAGECFVATGYRRLVGRSTGTGHCVALVQAASPELGRTRTWAAGAPVQGAALQPGTVIATFDRAGRYANATNGTSHAAIYLGQDESGIQVLDQWSGRAAAVRTIPWSNPGGAAVDTAGNYRVVTRQG